MRGGRLLVGMLTARGLPATKARKEISRVYAQDNGRQDIP